MAAIALFARDPEQREELTGLEERTLLADGRLLARKIQVRRSR